MLVNYATSGSAGSHDGDRETAARRLAVFVDR